MNPNFTIYFLTALLFCNTLSAQAPQGVNYQAVIRDGNGAVVASGTVNLRFTVRKNFPDGTNYYQETQTVTPNAYGMVTAVIGKGTQIGQYAFNTIQWGTGKYFLQVEADPTGGNNFVNLGTATEFQSVPYALSSAQWASVGNYTYTLNPFTNVGIGTTTPDYMLSLYNQAATLQLYNPVDSVGIYLSVPSTTSTGGIGTVGKYPLIFFAGSADHMILDTAGNLGIGTNNPRDKLSIEGDAPFVSVKDPLFGSEAAFGPPSHSGTGGIGTTTNHNFPLFTNGVDRVTISAAGNVGIGTNNPPDKLSIAGDGSQGISIRSSLGNNAARGYLAFGTTNPSYQQQWAGIVSWSGSAIDQASLSFYTCNGTREERMFISAGGYVGLGTNTPTYPLQVEGTRNVGLPLSTYRYLTSSAGVGLCTNCTPQPISIFAKGSVYTMGEVNVASDARIKNIEGPTDNAQDLETLSKIVVTNYTMKDKLAGGNSTYKKVIAQQVKQVYPMAVKTGGGPIFIPNVFEMAKAYSVSGDVLTITLSKPAVKSDDFKEGLNFKCYVYETNTGVQKEVKGMITAIDNDKVALQLSEVLELSKYTGELFAYGTAVSDFLAVDYDAIAMLNVSATQELAKQVAALQTENAALRSCNEALQAEMKSSNSANASLKADIDLIKSQLNIRSQANPK